MYQCTFDMFYFFFVFFFNSTAENGYSSGRQYGYSVAPISSCKSLLSAFAWGNLRFQGHKIVLHVKGNQA